MWGGREVSVGFGGGSAVGEKGGGGLRVSVEER